ncbi:SDR family oxidoreductase [Nocardia cyriacigeorgica]|uniref:SDR family oxidoreductase n=1 Tax=Nocardia cyriacigeorgica TaxID=135487 RepID=A0ABX0CY82_9NOCA|nr:SDR family oxidoreductase [Nocardia cyriacigeorgica]NEW42437.1 SDR family oxidoreductase [Nocardia cyriacigeorgica]NEW52596.1 SDR family oxidoreductase [Nocardia cyriacigeorgica]NEW59235.1 SDR family oxidoreductase [Nocardia cyriacigeorgica]
MPSNILVTGGTGTLGRHVTPMLSRAGVPFRVLSRHGGHIRDGIEFVTGDLLKNEGIDAAVADVDTILHLAGDAKTDAETTRTLMTAAARAGVGHVVYISVTAPDSLPVRYYRQKTAAEKAVVESGVPWTTLRAAQFHDLVFTIVSTLAKSPVTPAPGGMRFQSVESAEVARRLVELTLGEPSGLVRDLVGPEVLELPEVTRQYLRATGKRRLLLPVRIPGALGRAYRAGDNLVFGCDEGKRTWADFLAEHTR